jgi:hypothetical protein
MFVTTLLFALLVVASAIPNQPSYYLDLRRPETSYFSPLTIDYQSKEAPDFRIVSIVSWWANGMAQVAIPQCRDGQE